VGACAPVPYGVSTTGLTINIYFFSTGRDHSAAYPLDSLAELAVEGTPLKVDRRGKGTEQNNGRDWMEREEREGKGRKRERENKKGSVEKNPNSIAPFA